MRKRRTSKKFDLAKEVKLASTTSITSNYAGELARPYVAAAVLGGSTLGRRLVQVLENVKYKANISEIAVSSLIQAATCDFTDEADVTLTEQVLQPIEWQVNLELCKSDWISQWEAASMGAGKLNESIPPTIQSFLLTHVAAKVAEQMEYEVWQGNDGLGGGYTLFDGFDKEIEDEAVGGNNQQSISGTTFTSSSAASGILPSLETFLSNIPTAVLSDPDFTIMINQKHAFAYMRSLAALGHANDYYINEKPLNYVGYRMEVANGIRDDRMYAGPSRMFVFGTDLLSDQVEANVIDMALTDGSKNVRIVMRGTGGTKLAVPENVYQAKDVA